MPFWEIDEETEAGVSGGFSGAATGAAIGTQFGGPGIGTAIGAGIGLLQGLSSAGKAKKIREAQRALQERQRQRQLQGLQRQYEGQIESQIDYARRSNKELRKALRGQAELRAGELAKIGSPSTGTSIKDLSRIQSSNTARNRLDAALDKQRDDALALIEGQQSIEAKLNAALRRKIDFEGKAETPELDAAQKLARQLEDKYA